MGGKFDRRGKPTVQQLLGQEAWNKERKRLRGIVLDCGLEETVKWGKLCYAFEGSNLAIIYGLKNCCAIGFLKGALLKDPRRVLLKPGENSQSGRWIKFSGLDEIATMEPIVRAYLHEAVEAERAGLRVSFKARNELVFPSELQEKFAKDPAFKTAFLALTPGRQRGYNLLFSEPKQSKTRVSRIEKSRQRILDGKGRHDR